MVGAPRREREWESLYIAQASDEASRLPLRVALFDATQPILVETTDGWPVQEYEGEAIYNVYLYGLDSASQWSDSYPHKVHWQIVNSELSVEDYSYNGALASLQDLLVRVSCVQPPESPSVGVSRLHLRLRNQSVVTLYLDKQVLSSMASGESLCLWVGLDGSTFWAGGGHAATNAWAQMVTQNARYAMGYDEGAVFVTAYAGRAGDPEDKRSPAVDIFDTLDAWSNGTISTDGTVDDNETPGTDPVRHLLDGGYHYWGWNYWEER